MSWSRIMRYQILVHEGVFDAVVCDIRELKGRHGSMVCIDFRLDPDESGPILVAGVANRKLSSCTKLGRWVKAILGRMLEVGEAVTSEDLLWKQCRVVIKHRKTPDGHMTYASVAKVLAPAAPF